MRATLPEPANDIASALESYVAPPPEGRRFSVKDTAVVLLVMALTAIALDSEGLLAWARRLEVGRAQAVLVQTLTPLHALLTRAHCTEPRAWVAKLLPQSSDEALLAEGWVPAAPVVKRVVLPMQELDVTPPPPEEAPVVVEPTSTPGGVLLLGDSMIAGSLGATMERMLAHSSGLPVTRAAQLGTGLARPDVYDWMKVLPVLLQKEQPKFVVVSIGANDATNLREGEEQIDYGEARWKQVYAGRVEAMMRALAGTDTRVLWLMLPPMRDRRLSLRANSLNALFAQCARRVPRVEVLELDVLIADADKQYATFVQAPDGKLLRYRLDDGVHLAPAGSRVVSKWVQDWLRERRR